MFRQLLFIGILMLFAGSTYAQMHSELVYVSDRSGKLEIYLTDSEASFNSQITNFEQGLPYDLSWSPDGEFILFTLYKKGKQKVYRIHPDGSNLQLLMNDTNNYKNISASPIGDRWAVVSDRDQENNELYIFEQESPGSMKRLTNNELLDSAPRFSPDGNKLVFCRQITPPNDSEPAGNGEIFVMDVDGSNERRVTNKPGFDCLPSWSPDGSKIAFHGCDENSRCDIYLINPDGTEMQKLTRDEYDNRWPMWSPDGKWIAYTSVRDDQTDIYIIRRDGSEIKQITTHTGNDEVAAWRPVQNER